MVRLLAAARRPAARRLLTATWIGVAAVVTVVTARHLLAGGWPLGEADPVLLVSAAIAFLLAYALKAYGWKRLFIASERPDSLALAAAAGAAAVTGIALPGRFDDAVRIAVVRRHPGARASVPTLGLSLFMLALVDTAALAPLSATAAATVSGSLLRAGFVIVAAAGVGAAAAIVFMPHLLRSPRASRFRVGRWLGLRTTSLRDAWEAWALVTASWLVRALGLFLLLGALGGGLSLPLALAYLCASAGSAAVPIAPAGAATQAGAGAAVLIATGMPASRAIGLALAAQLLVILAGAAVVLASVSWHGGRRLGRRLLPAV